MWITNADGGGVGLHVYVPRTPESLELPSLEIKQVINKRELIINAFLYTVYQKVLPLKRLGRRSKINLHNITIHPILLCVAETASVTKRNNNEFRSDNKIYSNIWMAL